MGRDSMGLLGVLTGGNDPYTNGERERRREARERSQERFSEFFGGLGDAAEEDPSLLGHFGLDLVGLVPGWGAFADLANAAWYAAEGDYESAARSAVYAIPVVGDIVAVVDMAEAGVELLSDPDVVQAIIESIDSASVPMSASSAVGKLATKLKGLAKKGGKGAKKAGKVGKQGGTVIVNGNGPCGGPSEARNREEMVRTIQPLTGALQSSRQSSAETGPTSTGVRKSNSLSTLRLDSKLLDDQTSASTTIEPENGTLSKSDCSKASADRCPASEKQYSTYFGKPGYSRCSLPM